jgi:hypothetical protein
MRTVFDKLKDVYAKHYSPTEHIAVSEIIVLIKGRVVFGRNTLKKHEKFVDENLQAMWFREIYLQYDHVRIFARIGNVTTTMTATYTVMTQLTARIENVSER